MLTTRDLDCPVCGGRDTLTACFHRHGVEAPDGERLVTVADYACERGCSVPLEDLLRLGGPG